MGDILKMARIQIVVIILFIFFKLIRPMVLSGRSPEFFKKFLLSFPNFCEGVIAVLILTGFGIYLNRYITTKNTFIYLIAIVLASIFVITQEIKIHNLGGYNIYDPNDLIYSIIGILVGAVIVFRLNPQIRMND